ncbi:unnamed protein product [Pseudo-nitzschia multistriata]|uniref:Methyltransferase type 11 domain-containing protein n=1 Tax=Pseudo-nitzschia multistriata TaxID=183589 RepID=A0A448ZML3_9STRA|nr:unnamed protein product [Pseudo-nitzschia multistriata]
MQSDGWLGEIVSIDFSTVVIDQMEKRYRRKENERKGKQQQQFFAPGSMRFVCADITEGLPFCDNEFDLVVCKGTFDAILCSSGSVNHAKRLVAECERVLAKGHGCFFLCSYGSPDNRLVFLEHQNDPSYYWENIGVHPVARKNQRNDYVYICRKKETNASENVVSRPLVVVTNEENMELPAGEPSREPQIARSEAVRC